MLMDALDRFVEGFEFICAGVLQHDAALFEVAGDRRTQPQRFAQRIFECRKLQRQFGALL